MPDDGPDGGCRTTEADVPALLDPEYDDDLFRALADDDRRRVLYVLAGAGESTVSDLAAVLVGWERMGERSVATRPDRDRRATKLEQVDLPHLAAAGLVRFDPEAGTVALAELPEPTRAVVQWARANETGVDAWYRSREDSDAGDE